MHIRRRLIRHGFVLFLLGLLTGFAIPAMLNPRAGLAAHLEGVLNGMFLLIAGLAWTELRLTERAGRVLSGLLLFGTYANWVAVTASGILGTSKGTPINPVTTLKKGEPAPPIQANLKTEFLKVIAPAELKLKTVVAAN